VDDRGKTILDPERDNELAVLLAEAQKGDQGAYEKFLREASVMLRGFLIRRMGRVEIAEDVLQETLLSVHRARHTHIPGRPVAPWLFAICQHRMTDYYRRHRRIERVEVLATEEVVELGYTTDTAEYHRGNYVLEALARLPEKQRQVIELLKLQGFSVKEVAVLTDMSESSVKVTAFRGYEAIRRIFGVKQK
jgi:RNA polymerase sigma-70 factor (ECF subfamily)